MTPRSTPAPAHLLRGGTDQVAGVDVGQPHLEGPRADPLHVEQVVDQAGEALAALGRHRHHGLDPRRQLTQGAAGQQPQRSADRGERGPQLVADHGEELVLHPLDLAPLGDVAEDHDGASRCPSSGSSTGFAVTSTGNGSPPTRR